MQTVGALLRLARLGNASIAALGVLTGGVLLSGWGAHWASLAFAAACAFLGVAAGNILNDVRDVEVDRRAHPTRVLARGDLTVAAAARWSRVLFALALLCAALANVVVLAAAGVLVLCLLVYEWALKQRGLLGNVWISGVVACTFVVGALAAPVPPFSYGEGVVAVVGAHPRLALPFVVALLALLANTAREVFKDVEDAAGDRGSRRTLPMRIGASGAMWVGRAFLGLAIVFAVSGFFRHADLGAQILVDASLLAPALVVMGVATTRDGASAAQRWTKWGMGAATLAFLVMGLV